MWELKQKIILLIEQSNRKNLTISSSGIMPVLSV